MSSFACRAIAARLVTAATRRRGAGVSLGRRTSPPVAISTSRGLATTSRAAAAADGDAATKSEGARSEDAQQTLAEVTKKLMDCRKRKAAANAVDLLVGLGHAGIQPDLLASTACLGACVAAGKMDLALKVFEEVFDKGVVKPDEVVFTELIRGHLRADPPAWARITGLLNRMPEHGVNPTALTYNLLLARCADDNELERAEALVDRMADDGIEPDG